ncbi:Uncharacterised protein [Mycobacteroides abscessus subsp. abscessus]|nr:Uncharacterised protein [Mycobacteroides abscessus subsp. abscessus]
MKIGENGTTSAAGTATSSRVTVPEAVVRWPMPSQSSSTVRPAASRGTNAIAFGVAAVGASAPSLSDARTTTQSANSAPVA